MRLSAEMSKFLTKIMTMGAGTSLPIIMTSVELCKLIGVIYHDNNCSHILQGRYPDLAPFILPSADYYDMHESWFDELIPLLPNAHIVLIEQGINDIEDFVTYLKCLSEIHKRRKKYQKILSGQPLPKMVQVSPRSLIEYGTMNPQCLASWLTWRKFFYDIDNRAAQETGYLFEPILASALGGEQMSARNSAVRRTGDASKGRQVDCWKVMANGTQFAYEFKLRVTIAASGQGRFSEEIQFAVDACNSGAKPILLVLDPTMNPRLDDLQQAYIQNGGAAYLGDAAWQHLEEQAGEVMSQFIERYVRRPIEDISRFETNSLGFYDVNHSNLLDLNISNAGGRLNLQIGGYWHCINRQVNYSLPDDSSEE
ncbi:hypothetical protein F6R80_000544 [Enterobacter asburiae]|nr:hypothetical protein [Enterobacter asburiae]